MPNPCYYHPQAAAVGNCIQCGTPGCGECLEDVGEKMACRRCSPALKSRLAARAAASAPPAAPPANMRYGPDPGYDPALGITPPPRRNYIAEAAAAEAAAAAAVPQSVRVGRRLMGLGLASAVGFLGALGIEKIAFTSNFDITILYVVLAVAVAASLRAFTGRGGVATGFIATGVMIVCLGFGHWLYVQDVLNQANAAGGLGAGATDSGTFSAVMDHLNPTHWMLVLCSVIACFSFGYREFK